MLEESEDFSMVAPKAKGQGQTFDERLHGEIQSIVDGDGLSLQRKVCHTRSVVGIALGWKTKAISN